VSSGSTLDAYEAGADHWIAQRPPETDRSSSFGASLHPGDAPVADLGCGPGWHLPDLPEGTIALDGAAAMLARVPEFAGAAPRVRADLRGLPFRRHGLGAAWANKSYVHLERPAVPLALWDLHRCLRVDGRAALGLFGTRPDDGADAEHRGFPDDPLPGRRFSYWPEDLLEAVIEGAGFSQLDRTATEEDGTVPPDVHPAPGADPGRHRRDGHAAAGGGTQSLAVRRRRRRRLRPPGNRMWPALLASGLADADRDPLGLLHRGIGMTDLVKRATTRADALDRSEFEHGIRRLEVLCRWLRPAAVCVLGVTGWRAATGDRGATVGPQDRRLGERPVHVAPNPSGLNAHTSVSDLVGHLQAAVDLGARPGSTP
jgi:double-stranded uracil-DNA glycosylase